MSIEVLVGIIKALYDMAEKIYTRSKDSSKEQQELSLEENRKILSEVSDLIDRFAETCDLIVETIFNVCYPDRSGTTAAIVRISQANRRLFEISSDMRVLMASLSTRLAKRDTDAIARISDSCFQIIMVETHVSMELVSQDNFGLLPIDVSPKAMKPVHRNLFPNAYCDYGAPFDTDRPSLTTMQRVNEALLALRKCKEDLAKALYEIDQES